MNKKIIAIIPARSGSKGLKDKNIKELNGKPLIAYSIEAAKEAGIFDEIIVSTDSEKYAQIARHYGANVPFLRSEENSSDTAGSWGVVREVLSKLEDKFDIAVLLQPTSPLRTAKNIVEAYQMLLDKNADTVCSVCETAHSAFWCNVLDENNSMENFIDKKYQVPRQQLQKTYTLNGAIYIIKTELIESPDFYSKNSFAYVMKKEESIDIDSEFDFKYAEVLMNN